MSGCTECGGWTRRCVWNGRAARIMECLTCGYKHLENQPIPVYEGEVA